MNKYELDYLNLLSDVLSNGRKSSNRTEIDTRKAWGRQIHIDLSQGFPLLTTKKMHWKSVVHELLWMISGDTNIQYLLKNGVTFWSEWPYQKYLNACGAEECNDQKAFEQKIINDDEFAQRWGSIGEYGYGGLWTKFPFYTEDDEFRGSAGITGEYDESWVFGSVNQLIVALEELKSNPDSRRIIISAWHPYHSNRKEDALLPACHNYVQFGTEELNWFERNYLYIGKMKGGWAGMTMEDYDSANIPKYKLNCYYNMRSSDIFLGLPFNCAFYSLLTHLIANQLNMIPGEVVYSAADVHLYENHVEQVKLQLKRTVSDLPKISIKTKGKSIFDIKYDDIELIGYNPQPAIKADVAV
jgi:thymidylate synthase